jgi:hypothetical protein
MKNIKNRRNKHVPSQKLSKWSEIKHLPFIIVSIVVFLAGSVGLVFATGGGGPSVTESTYTVTEAVYKNGLTIIEIKGGGETTVNLDVPFKQVPGIQEQIEQVNPRPKYNEVQLTNEEVTALHQEGFTFEQIGYAIELANNEQTTDVRGLLRDRMDEVLAFKQMIDSTKKLETDPNQVLDKRVLDYWVAQGYLKRDVQIAFSMSKRHHLPLDKVLEMMKSGEIKELYYKEFEKAKKAGGGK